MSLTARHLNLFAEYFFKGKKRAVDQLNKTKSILNTVSTF